MVVGQTQFWHWICFFFLFLSRKIKLSKFDFDSTFLIYKIKENYWALYWIYKIGESWSQLHYNICPFIVISNIKLILLFKLYHMVLHCNLKFKPNFFRFLEKNWIFFWSFPLHWWCQIYWQQIELATFGPYDVVLFTHPNFFLIFLNGWPSLQ
jgi:hypothetical protein